MEEEQQIVSPPKKSGLGKRVLIIVSVLVALYVVYFISGIFISPDRNIRQIYLVPADAAFIVQFSNPVDDWKTFSNSPGFQTMRKAKAFAEMAQNIDRMDSVILSNQGLLSLVGKRDMLLSIHKVRARDWDFLIVLDMQKTSKLNLLKDQIEVVLRMTDFTVTHRSYSGVSIIEMRDPETHDILYAAFVENHFIASYTSRLVEASIDARNTPQIGLDYSFMEAEKLVAGKGLFRMFVNYANLPEFMSIYLGGSNEYMDMFSQSMDFAGLYLLMEKEKVEMKGYTLRKEKASPYMTALLNSGKHRMKAHEIMSARTSFYMNIGFGDLPTFVKELEGALSTEDAAAYNSYADTRRRLEKYFGFSFEEHFLSWMSGEFALSQSEPGLLGSDPELILAVGTKDIEDAREKMAYIEKRIKNRTPVKVKTVSYKGFDVNYVEMKGFFRLFFGSLFDTFEKPYYTYIDDYVVFSNKPSSLLSFIEDYEQGNVLKGEAGFKKALGGFETNSTLFLYTDIRKFYPQLRPLLNVSTWNELQSDRNVLYSFPYWTMQVVGDSHLASLQYTMAYEPYEPEVSVAIDSDEADEKDSKMDEDAETEKELMNELKRFYVEKFQGNVLREFYPEGELQSESEVKAGKRHGRYREYYENGTLKVRGKFVNNRPKGTWKYYTEEGKFDRKVKY
ncbi:MAG: DUF3352 domain-containing protein [Tannerellaceae bacterium]|jgi:hypothetical protein|nr:DUF3352 domain-containing protein [Tannerellaceae bacterium]